MSLPHLKVFHFVLFLRIYDCGLCSKYFFWWEYCTPSSTELQHFLSSFWGIKTPPSTLFFSDVNHEMDCRTA